MQTPDKKKFLDMQEHPEQFSDEQLEAMMDELDRVPDVSAAWQRFEKEQCAAPRPNTQFSMFNPEGFASGSSVVGKAGSDMREPRERSVNVRFKKLAAIFIGVILLSGIAYAAIHMMTRSTADDQQSSMVNGQRSMVNVQSPDPVRFEDVRLDSILSVVSAYYTKAVSFSDDEVKAMKFILTWQPDAPLDDFIDGMNTFDGLQLTLQRDTIFVEAQEVTEDAE